jgi:hypothetical protein
MSTFYEKAWSERVTSEAKALAHSERNRPSSRAASSKASSAKAEALPAVGGASRPPVVAKPTAGALLAQLPPRPASRSHAVTTAGTNFSNSRPESIASSMRRHESNTTNWVKNLPPASQIGTSILPPNTRRSTGSGSSVFTTTSLPSRPSTLALSGATTYRQKIAEYEDTLRSNNERMSKYEQDVQMMRSQLEQLTRAAKERQQQSSS